MASFRIDRLDLFPEGTVVKAYAAASFHVAQPGAPSGAVAGQGTVSSGVAEVTGLTAGTAYVAYASVSGADRTLSFRPEEGATIGSGAIPLTQRGAAEGVATLDGAARLPLTQFPEAFTVVNGSTQAAFTAAIAALPTVKDPILGNIKAGTVIVPPRLYSFSGVVVVPSYVRFDGLHRAILARAEGYAGLFFESAEAITQFALDGFIWDNGGTANRMWQFPCGSSKFEQLWARYQNLSAPPGVFLTGTGSTFSSDLTFRDISLYGVGSISNQPGITIFDASDVKVENIKAFGGMGALKIEAAGNTTATIRNITVDGVEGEGCEGSMVLIRQGLSGQMENVTVKNLQGYQCSAGLQKGLLAIGEAVGGSPGDSKCHNITVENVQGRDWKGHLIELGGGPVGADIRGFTISNVEGDALPANGTPDYTRGSLGLSIEGAQHGTIDGLVIKNAGRRGLGIFKSAYQVARYITGTNIDIDTCCQGRGLTEPHTWEECGVFIGPGCSDLDLQGRSINNYSEANEGGAKIGAGVGSTIGSVLSERVTLRFQCEDTRAEKFQDYGVRIGVSGADGEQPNKWTIIRSGLENNKLGPFIKYGSTDHGHQIVNNKGVGGRLLSGSGTPEAKVTGSVGDVYLRTDGAGGTVFYVKESGENTNTGWVAHAATTTATGSRPELVVAGRKLISETFNLLVAAQGASTTSSVLTEEVRANLIGLKAGDICTGVVFNMSVSAPTSTNARVGLWNKAGELLAKSADRHTELTSEKKEWNFESPFEVPLTEAYYVGYFNVLSAGSVSIMRGGDSSFFGSVMSSGLKAAVKQTGQAAIPTNAVFVAGTTGFYFGIY